MGIKGSVARAKLRQEGEAPSEPEADPRTLGETCWAIRVTAVAAWILERQSCVGKTGLRLGRGLAPPTGQSTNLLGMHLTPPGTKSSGL
jgi:hypothetical protein